MMTHEQMKIITKGSIVQLDPNADDRFGGCLFIVSEKKDWGIQGYTSIPAEDGTKQAYYRAKWEELRYCGEASWYLP